MTAWLALGVLLTASPQPVASSPLVRCEIEDVAGDVRCGTLEVPENRDGTGSRRIPLNIAVLKAATAAAEPDAFFVLQGGPGQSAVRLASFYAELLDGVRKRRDVVLVDVRGTGRSNPLACDLHPEGSSSTELLPGGSLGACRATLEARADLRQYTTSNIVTDLESVRSVLGYQRINFYGTSYGTRVALEFLRQHPKQVRTLTLKGIVPPFLAMPVTHARDGQQALDRILARCEADHTCRKAFPSVREELRGVLDRLRAQPLRTSLKTQAGQTPEVLISEGLFGEALRNLLYAPQTLARVPLLIRRAATGDLSGAAESVERIKRALSADIAIGMFLSVTCAEDVPFIAPRDAVPAEVFGDFRVRQQQQACEAWVQGRVPSDFHSPVRSDRPALLISGALDPVTPPRFGEEVAKGLSSSLHVIVPNNGHPMGTLAPCAARLIAAFVERGVTDGLDTSCAQTLEPVPFVVQ